MQRGELRLAERGAVVAEQGAGGRIGLQDRVGVRIDEQHRVNGEIERGGAGGGLLGRDLSPGGSRLTFMAAYEFRN